MSAKHKLAIVVPSLDLGGAERIAAMQADWFAAQGYAVTLITLDGSARNHYRPQHVGITHMYLPGNRPKLLFDYVRKHGIDLTIDHAHWHEKHFVFFEMMGASKHRLLIFDHSTYFYPLYVKSKWPVFEHRASAYGNADAVCVLTRHTCRLFQRDLPATVFIPNPLSYPSNAISKVLQSRNIIAVANWQRSEKRLDRIMEIFSAVLQLIPDSYLILVGPVNQLELEELLRSNQIAPEKIECVGRSKNVESHYLRSRVLLHASELEGFGLVLNEAGMHGLPRVAMNSPGMDEVIEHGIDGYLAAQGDRQATANYLVSLLTDDQLCQRMSENVLSSVQRFSLEKTGKRWEWLVRLVLGVSSSAELEKEIVRDCRRQGVDEIDAESMVMDYEAQLKRLIRLFGAKQNSIDLSAGNIHPAGVEIAHRPFRSTIARALSVVSEALEARYVARLIRKSGLFDQQWYEEQYPDIKASRIDAALHYVKFGAQEGRNPSKEFDTRQYLSDNGDTVTRKQNPLLHYLEAKKTSVCPPERNLSGIEGQQTK